MAFYIGVDGGGTKTAYALFNEKKELLDLVKTPGSNHENLPGSFDEAVEIIWSGVSALLAKNGLTTDDVAGCLMGLAGVDHPFQHDALYERLFAKGLRRFELYNDGFIVTKAGTPDGVGIGLNLGTGTCCNSIDDRGQMLQLGGFGAYSGDAGNGWWIAEQTYCAIYRDLVLLTRPTAMTGIFCEKAGIAPEADAFVALVSNFDGDGADAQARLLSDTMFEAANQGDAEALAIVEAMSDAAADLVAAHAKRQTFDRDVIPVVLSGSMNTKMPNEVFLRRLREKAQSRAGRSFDFIKLTAEPVTGCINWMLESTRKEANP